MNTIKFTKSLKFKMTFWYSILLLIFSLFLVLTSNILITRYMQRSSPFQPLFLSSEDYIEREITEEQLGLIRESRLKDLDNIRIISIYSIIPLTLLSFVGGYLISDRMLSPLEYLNREMRTKDAKNIGTPIKFKDREDEISSLIKQFNSMSIRVANSFKSQREFVENASHEIKTPLAVIQANLQTALEDKKITQNELRELLEESSKSVKFMNNLTENLLLLSLLDTEMEKKSLKLLPLIDETKTLVTPIIDGNKFQVNITCPRDIYITGNKVLLIRSFQNIIENAIKYSEGTKIDILVEKQDKQIKIVFADDGKGISKDKCEKIF